MYIGNSYYTCIMKYNDVQYNVKHCIRSINKINNNI